MGKVKEVNVAYFFSVSEGKHTLILGEGGLKLLLLLLDQELGQAKVHVASPYHLEARGTRGTVRVLRLARFFRAVEAEGVRFHLLPPVPPGIGKGRG